MRTFCWLPPSLACSPACAQHVGMLCLLHPHTSALHAPLQRPPASRLRCSKQRARSPGRACCQNQRHSSCAVCLPLVAGGPHRPWPPTRAWSRHNLLLACPHHAPPRRARTGHRCHRDSMCWGLSFLPGLFPFRPPRQSLGPPLQGTRPASRSPSDLSHAPFTPADAAPSPACPLPGTAPRSTKPLFFCQAWRAVPADAAPHPPPPTPCLPSAPAGRLQRSTIRTCPASLSSPLWSSTSCRARWCAW